MLEDSKLHNLDNQATPGNNSTPSTLLTALLTLISPHIISLSRVWRVCKGAITDYLANRRSA